MMAFVKVAVVPVPFRSGVSSDVSPDWTTARVAFSSLQDASIIHKAYPCLVWHEVSHVPCNFVAHVHVE